MRRTRKIALLLTTGGVLLQLTSCAALLTQYAGQVIVSQLIAAIVASITDMLQGQGAA